MTFLQASSSCRIDDLLLRAKVASFADTSAKQQKLAEQSVLDFAQDLLALLEKVAPATLKRRYNQILTRVGCEDCSRLHPEPLWLKLFVCLAKWRQ